MYGWRRPSANEPRAVKNEIQNSGVGSPCRALYTEYQYAMNQPQTLTYSIPTRVDLAKTPLAEGLLRPTSTVNRPDMTGQRLGCVGLERGGGAGLHHAKDCQVLQELHR